jgi:alkylation response protein AidB-like acyl-CoA dehydrogenase
VSLKAESVVPFEKCPEAPAAKDWLALARSITPIIEKDVPLSEEIRTMSPDVVDALKQTGLFWMFTPTEVGGGGCGYRDIVLAIEELSFADTSAGWSFMANSETIAAAGAFCGDTAIDAMFGGPELPIMAGQLGPNGRCVQVDGGYRGSGHYSYGSGMAHSNWVGGGMLVLDDGKPRMLPHGPEVQICFLPRDKIEPLDNWYVAGLSATGSFDYVIPEQFIADDFTMERATPVQKRGAPLFGLGFAPIVAMGHAAVVLGAMKRALHEIARITHEKKRVGYPGTIDDYPTFRDEFGMAEANYMAARHYILQVFDEAEAAANAGVPVTDYQRARFRQVAAWIHKIGSDVVRACYTWSGAEGFRGSTAMGRAFRDMHVATNHLFIDPVNIVGSAPALLDHYRDRCPDAPTA